VGACVLKCAALKKFIIHEKKPYVGQLHTKAAGKESGDGSKEYLARTNFQRGTLEENILKEIMLNPSSSKLISNPNY